MSRTACMGLSFLTAIAALLAPAATTLGGGELPLPPAPDPRQPVDYLAWAKQAYTPPADLDAAPLYAKVMRLWPYEDADEFLKPYLRGPWTEETPAWRARLLKYDWARRAYLEAIDRPRCFIPLVAFGDFADFIVGIDLGDFRWPAKLLIAQAWGAFGRGEEGEIIDAASRCLRTAEHLIQQPLLVAQLQGARLVELAGLTLMRALENSADRNALVERHWRKIIDLPGPRFPRATLFAGELLGSYDSCQRCFDWKEESSAYVLDRAGVETLLTLHGEGHPQISAAARERLEEITFESTLRLIDDYYELQRQLLALPYAEFMRRKSELDRYVDRHHEHSLTELLVYRSGTVVGIRRRLQGASARWHAMRIVWVLFETHRRRGAFPAALGELPPEGQPSVRFACDPDFNWQYTPRGKDFTLQLVEFGKATTYWPLPAD